MKGSALLLLIKNDAFLAHLHKKYPDHLEALYWN